MRIQTIPAGTGNYPDYKTYGTCDKCDRGATHKIDYATGQPRRYCRWHWAAWCKQRKVLESRIMAMRDEVAANLREHFPDFADYLGIRLAGDSLNEPDQEPDPGCDHGDDRQKGK